MWGESSKNCEFNCQCSGLITDSFKINSGNSATKRKQEEATSSNFKLKMNPHTLDFKSPSPIHTPSKRRVLGEIHNSPSLIFRPPHSPIIERLKNSPIERKKSPIIDRNALSPLTTRSFKRTTKISRIFEERSRFKMSNKENDVPSINERFIKLDVEEETRDCSFNGFQTETKISNWSMTKLDFTDALQTKSYEASQSTTTSTTAGDMYVPEKDVQPEMEEFETLHDLEEEFESDNFDQCTKYEIISTDSPNIISRGRSSTSRKVNSKNFEFGAPLAECEQSTSFNRPNVNATRMLNFEDETFEFTSPAAKRQSSFSVKKSLKFHETPTKNPLRHERSDSSIGSMASSPSSSQLRIFTSESTTSMESGFISELEEPFLDLEEASNSPKMANFNDLLSGQIKENIITNKDYLKRPSLQRSLSFNPEPKAKLSLFSIQESPDQLKRSQKRAECPSMENVAQKKRKSEQSPPPERARPVLQRAFSENHASIMSALTRSTNEPDLIGDFSLPYALPLTGGDHPDLKSISCDTLAALIRGDFDHSISEFKIIDCRYPYEFEGGHIPGAVNLYTPALVRGLLERPACAAGQPADKRSVLVFHCEFSLERGPKLYRYLRSSDRSKNMELYPNLNYPEIYLLHKGYHTFYQRYPELCSPAGYTAMLDPKHTHLLRKHRSVEEPTSFFTHHRTKSGHRLMY